MIISDKINKLIKALETYQAKPFVISQIEHAIYKRGITEYAQISTLHKDIRAEIIAQKGNKTLRLTVLNEQNDTQVQKVLFQTEDGHNFETVLMVYKPNRGRTHEHKALCLSTQSGCAMGCTFCATGATGFRKNLTEEEITDQVLYFIQKGIKIDSLFFSGMGEPLANPHIWQAIDVFTSPDYFGFGERKLSISTVGLIPALERLREEHPQINIAFSLHSPFDNQRQDIMPINKAYPLPKVIDALDKHIEATNRKIFLAYILLEGVNDTIEHARALAKLINSRPKAYLYHVNLIKYHAGPSEEKFWAPKEAAIEIFKRVLERHHVDVTIRQDFGINIDAACGQLAATYSKKRK